MVDLLVAMTFDQLSNAGMQASSSSLIESSQDAMTKPSPVQTTEQIMSQAHVHKLKSVDRTACAKQQGSGATSASSEAWKSILARHSTKDSLPSKPFTSESENSALQSSYANALPALARQHAAKLAVTPSLTKGMPVPSYNHVSFVHGTSSTSGMMTTAPVSLAATSPVQVLQSSQHIITSSPSTTFAAAAHLATMGVGVGPGINPNIAAGASGVGINSNSSNPPIVNTGNNGPMYVQPGDWVCSACGFVNWRRRRVCMRCYPFADQTEVSKQIAQGAVLAAQLAAGVDLSPDTITSLTLSRKSAAAHSAAPAAASTACSSEASCGTNASFNTSNGSVQNNPAAGIQAQGPDFSVSQVPSASAARQRPGQVTKDITLAQSTTPSTLLFASLSHPSAALTCADDYFGPHRLAAPRYGESGSRFASARPSPMHTPRKTCSNLAVGSGNEFPWSSSNIWSTPGTPNHSCAKTYNSPLVSPSVVLRPPAAVELDSSSSMDAVKNRAQSASPATPLTSSPSLLDAQLGERLDLTDDASIKSALTSFIDENDEIVKPTPRSARQGFALALNSTSPPQQEPYGALSTSSSGEALYQHAAIEPPCHLFARGSSDSAK